MDGNDDEGELIMKQRVFGKTGKTVSEIGLGTWQLGAKWGEPFNEEEAQKIL